MASRRISQREARRLLARVLRLERERDEQRAGWATDYPCGVNIATLDLSQLPAELSAIRTARRLAHAVVAVTEQHQVRLYALPLPEAP